MTISHDTLSGCIGKTSFEADVILIISYDRHFPEMLP
jgi:hypothetical protein